MEKSYLEKNKTKQGGFMAFTSILVVSAITLGIAVSISLLGVNEARNSLDVKRGIETLKIAESCAEEALYRLKSNQSYTGGVLLVGDGQCSINVSGTAEDKTITITAQLTSISNYSKSMEVVAKLRGGGVVVSGWKQI